MATCGRVSKMEKLQEVHKTLKLLSMFLQPALPFINSHLNNFFTESYWELFLPPSVRGDLNAITVSELKVYFKTLASLKRKDIDTKVSSVTASSTSFTESSLQDVIDNIRQLILCAMNLSCKTDQFDVLSSADTVLSKENDDELAPNVGESCKTVTVSSDSGPSSWKLDPFMSPKKMHEVEIMSDFVEKVANFQDAKIIKHSTPGRMESSVPCHQSSLQDQSNGIEYLIDLGSGKGYLSSYLVLLYNYRVLAIDSSAVNTYGCTKRTATLEKNWSSFIRRAQERQTQSVGTARRGKHWKSKNEDKLQNLHITDPVTEMACDNKNKGAEIKNVVLTSNNSNPGSVSYNIGTEASEKLKNVTLYVVNDLNLSKLLHDNFLNLRFDAESCILYGMVGLHTCGQLGVDSIKLFCNSQAAKFLVNVPCCYHLLDERYEDDNIEVVGNLKADGSYGFPMSKHLQAIHFSVGRNARMMSAQSLHRMSSDESNLEISRPLLFRALLSVIIKKKLGYTALERNVGRIGGKFSNFHLYVRKALAKLELEGVEVSDDEIDEVYRTYEPLSVRFHKYFLLRALFAPLIEACIVLDRLAYLLEQESVAEAFIVELFDPFLSPRCHALVALR